MAPTLSVLTHYPGFRKLFLAELVVFGSDWFVMVPLLVLLNDLTGRGIWGALVLATDTGVSALLLPYTGTVADRADRKKIMIAANLAALVGVLLLFGVRTAGATWLAVATVGAAEGLRRRRQPGRDRRGGDLAGGRLGQGRVRRR